LGVNRWLVPISACASLAPVSPSPAAVRREVLAYLLAGLAAHSVVAAHHFGWWEIVAISIAAGLHIPKIVTMRTKGIDKV